MWSQNVMRGDVEPECDEEMEGPECDERRHGVRI